MNRNTKIVILAVALVFAGAVALWAKPNHPVSWDGREVTVEAVAGETSEVEVSFKAGRDLGDVALQLVPELASFGLSVSPETLAGLAKGETHTLTLSITMSPAAEPMTAEGTLHARPRDGNRTFAKPLLITVNVVWPEVASEEGEFSISYPAGFEEKVSSVSTLPSGEQTQLLSFRSELGDFTLEWQDGYPSGTPIDEWADQDRWPTPDGDWRGIYVLSTLNGREVLQDPDTGSVIMAVGDKEYHIFNGIGIEPTYVNLNTFQSILESLEFSE